MTADRAMAASEAAPSNGILPVQEIRAAIANGAIISDAALTAAQMQPASIDLRLGRRAWRVQSSFLPGPETRVADKLPRLAMHEIDLEGGAVLERGCLYIVELQESLALPAEISAMANPKSSTGRLDIFTRLITDGASEFEAVAAGYQGPLYAEISPRTFSVLVRPGSCLSQLRFRRGPSSMSDAAMIALQRDVGLVRGVDDVDIRDGVALGVNLTPDEATGIIGWRARKHAGLIDIDAPKSCARAGAAMNLGSMRRKIRRGVHLRPQTQQLCCSSTRRVFSPPPRTKRARAAKSMAALSAPREASAEA